MYCVITTLLQFYIDSLDGHGWDCVVGIFQLAKQAFPFYPINRRGDAIWIHAAFQHLNSKNRFPPADLTKNYNHSPTSSCVLWLSRISTCRQKLCLLEDEILIWFKGWANPTLNREQTTSAQLLVLLIVLDTVIVSDICRPPLGDSSRWLCAAFFMPQPFSN